MPELKSATPTIIARLAREALGGSVRAVRLWLQYVEGWNPRDPAGDTGDADVEINIGYDDEES